MVEIRDVITIRQLGFVRIEHNSYECLMLDKKIKLSNLITQEYDVYNWFPSKKLFKIIFHINKKLKSSF